MSKRKWTDQQLAEAVKNSFSIAQVLSNIGLHPTGCNYKAMHSNIQRLGLDASHFLGQGHLKNKTHNWTPKRPLDEVLISNSDYACTNSLKKRLLKEGLLQNHCYLCEQEPHWKGQPLVMVLDHINGTNNDNRIANLRLLCPNCNSQQPTFAGRNRKVV